MDTNNPQVGEQSNNTEPNNLTTQNKPQTNVLAILVVVAVLAVVGYMVYGKSDEAIVPSNNEPNPVATEVEQEKVLQTVDICGRTIALPSFIELSALQDSGREEPYPNWWTCQYKTPDNRFSITVLDKEDGELSETYADNFEAFSSFTGNANSSSIPEVGKIAITDTISTGIREVNLVEVLNKNSVGYTGQIFQDFSGLGVYQTATMIDNRYMVYITYVIMGIEEGEGWRQYFDERWTFEQKNELVLFREYLQKVMLDETTMEQIKEINQASRNIL